MSQTGRRLVQLVAQESLPEGKIASIIKVQDGRRFAASVIYKNGKPETFLEMNEKGKIIEYTEEEIRQYLGLNGTPMKVVPVYKLPNHTHQIQEEYAENR
jgi:hypothetical protein